MKDIFFIESQAVSKIEFERFRSSLQPDQMQYSCKLKIGGGRTSWRQENSNGDLFLFEEDLVDKQTTHKVKKLILVYLMITFKDPSWRSVEEFKKETGLKLYCSQKSSYSYVKVEIDWLKSYWGLKITEAEKQPIEKNQKGSSKYFKIEDLNHLAKNIKKMVKNIEIENDPQFQLRDDASIDQCKTLYKVEL